MSNINLLPWRIEKIVFANNIFYAQCALISTISILLSLGVNYYIKFLSSIQKQSINYLNSEIATYQSKIQEINGLKEHKKLLLTKLEVINSLQAKRTMVVEILDKLAKAVPDGIILTNVNFEDNTLTIKGKSESNSRISLFMRNLEGLKIFLNPALQEITAPQQSSPQEEEHSIVFSLKIIIQR